MDVKISKITKLYVHFLLCLVIISANFPSISSFCIEGCECNNNFSKVECKNQDVEAIPIQLSPSLEILIIKNSKLKVLNDSLSFLQSLKRLDLPNNEITTIPDNIFTYNGKLEELDLSFNSISSINMKTFFGLNSLTVLYLRGNIIEELDADIFAMLHKFKTLDLSLNKIAKVHPMAFNGLISLIHIYFHSNRIDSVPIEVFRSVARQLIHLTLGDNAFTSLPDDAFKDFKELISLQLNRNGGLNISDKAFRGMPNLGYLFFTASPVTRVPFDEIIEIGKLVHVSIVSTNSERNYLGCNVQY